MTLLENERNANLKEDISDHENRLNWRENRIITLEKDGREFKVSIGGLIKKMDSFITTIQWGLGVFITVSLFVIGILFKLGGELI